tara:strand:+ start:2407 stop:2775 length:369 start_codon:yes stop_codon:yes gene_type:complete
MKIFLPILFFTLYLGNSLFCEFIYPNAAVDYSEWLKYFFMKETTYEIMFFIALSIPLFKSSLISRSITVAVLAFVFGSIIDKGINNNPELSAHDVIVFAFALCVGIAYYLYKQRLNRKNNEG